MDNYILCGMQFGDEGKGSFVEYISEYNNVDCVVKYNGGSQASHTVTTPDGTIHKFSQLGSAMFRPNCHTYITKNMVVNLDNLMTEIEEFSTRACESIEDLLSRIHIHEDCYIVTPYHKLLNKLRELSLGKNRRGSVGTGVSEVMYLVNKPREFPFEVPLGIQVKNLFGNSALYMKFLMLYNYVKDFYNQNKVEIDENIPDLPENIKQSLEKEIKFLTSELSIGNITAHFSTDFIKLKNLYNCIYNDYVSFRKNYSSAIYEGSQGLLIDGKYGIKPNTTYLDTTNNFALDISYYRDNVMKIGIAKAFMSRHGLGVFPTEDDTLNSLISDNNQEERYWNGKIRFGWFDAVLFNYAQSINQVDEVYLSSLDKLSQLERIYICDSYIYYGIVDSEFKRLFDYTVPNSPGIKSVYITKIKSNDGDLSRYLKKCEPFFTTVDGWLSDISNIKTKSELPDNCIKYIKLLEKLINVPISVVSVGPTKNDKIRMC